MSFVDHLRRRQAGVDLSTKIQSTSKDSETFVRRLDRLLTYSGHRGCVNTISWNDKGDLILSGSDDRQLNIYQATSGTLLLSIRSGHRANIFSAQFLPNTSDSKIVSCAGDGLLHYTDVYSDATWGTMPFQCHSGPAYQVLTTPNDANEFLSCSEDGTVRKYDLRVKNRCVCHECDEDILLNFKRPVMAMASNPMLPCHLAVGLNDSTVRVYDRRMIHASSPGQPFSIFKPSSLEDKLLRVTSVQYSSDGQEVLVSYSGENVYLFSPLNDSNPLLFSRKETDRETDQSVCHHLDKECESQPPAPPRSPVRRLRLRGDWSDTGPTSRPADGHGEEGGNGDEEGRATSNFMTRVASAFSRWMDQSTEDSSDSETDPSPLNENDDEEEVQLFSSCDSDHDDTDSSAEDRQLALSDQERHGDDVLSASQVKSDASSSSAAGMEGAEMTSSDHQADEGADPPSSASPPLSHSRREDPVDPAVASAMASRIQRAFIQHLKNKRESERQDSSASALEAIQPATCMCYEGHRNARTMIKEANFWGRNHIVSGSDCGRIFIWNKYTGKIVNVIEADKHVVNCIQPHPLYPILATSGIDHDVKIWAPLLSAPRSLDNLSEIVKLNKKMLSETCHTLTVPANLMLRIMAMVSQRRRGEH